MIGRGQELQWGFFRSLYGGSVPVGTVVAVCYVALVVAMFIYFSPILYGYAIPESWYQSLMWLPSWR